MSWIFSPHQDSNKQTQETAESPKMECETIRRSGGDLRTHFGVTCTHRYFLGSSAHTFWGHMYTQVFSRVICAHILGSHVHTGIFWGHLRTHFGVTCTHRYFLGSSAHTFWSHMYTQAFSGVICAHILGSHVHTGIF